MPGHIHRYVPSIFPAIYKKKAPNAEMAKRPDGGHQARLLHGYKKTHRREDFVNHAVQHIPAAALTVSPATKPSPKKTPLSSTAEEGSVCSISRQRNTGTYYATLIHRLRGDIEARRRCMLRKEVLFRQGKVPPHRDAVAIAGIHSCGFPVRLLRSTTPTGGDAKTDASAALRRLSFSFGVFAAREAELAALRRALSLAEAESAPYRLVILSDSKAALTQLANLERAVPLTTELANAAIMLQR
ncbi:hypothetical protein HPB47_022481 [Ixodes persulcatus]|uniref:Uncharacterized protein n=1 Tax=Ixodes persulcatus TaxID=34615 RepID=A0AC60Q9K6_IXOPE|nr:hypothetical protein HPB47_022481 [Ixodes persulcatus]